MAKLRSGTSTDDFKVIQLLELLDDGHLVLPEFQRDFDWGDERVSQLLATIVRGWPAGSLLLQEFSEATSFFKLRGFDGGPDVKQDAVEFVVLDGQQRLTALYHAVYDSGPLVYAIRASSVTPNVTIDALEDGITAFPRQQWDENHRRAAFSLADDWVPFYALRSAPDYFAWRDEAVNSAPEPEKADAAVLLSDAYRHGLAALHSYELPAVVVGRNLEPEAIARIFERVNRGGLTLTAFDLMVAKTFEPGWNLREKWDSARNEYPLFDAFFKNDGMPIIRVIALQTIGRIRAGDVLGLQGLSVRTGWDDATSATADVLAFLEHHCGVPSREWLPYEGMITTLGAIALEFNLEEHAETVRKWFVSRAFGLAYDTASNTVAVEEYKRLRQVLLGEETLRPISISSTVMATATRKRRSALWRSFVAALFMARPLSPLTGQRVEDECVVVSLLGRETALAAGEESPHLLVLGLLLVDRDQKQKIDGVGPAGLDEFLRALPPTREDEVRRSQMLPHSQPDASGRPGIFVEKRLHELNSWLVQTIGYGFEELKPTNAL